MTEISEIANTVSLAIVQKTNCITVFYISEFQEFGSDLGMVYKLLKPTR